MQVDEDFNIRFVGLIRKYRCLYDKKVPEYRSKDYQEKAWQEISQETQENIVHCKERWRNLRACLSRYIKQQSSSDPQHKPYYLTEHMAYLLPFLKSRRQSMEPSDRRRNDISDTESTSSVDFTPAVEVEMKVPSQEIIFPIADGGCASPNSHFSKRIKLEPINCGAIDGHNIDAISSSENDMDFFRSILPDINGMTAQQKRKFKIGILELIDDVLEKYPADKINGNCSAVNDVHMNGYWKK